MRQYKIPAVYMRGGTSKGIFFKAEDLPADSGRRDLILLRALGSPDPYGNQLDGLGDANPTTNRVVLVSKSYRDDCDVDFICGQVAIDTPTIDWSGNFANLAAAVGPFAISEDLCDAPAEGMATVRMWQAGIGKKIVAYVPMHGGEVVEEGDFVDDGVAFPAAQIRMEFLDPAAEDLTAPENLSHVGLFPTGNARDLLNIAPGETIEVTMVDAGNPTVLVLAEALGLSATETKEAVNNNTALLARMESIRAAAAVAMGIAKSPEDATALHPQRPKLAFIAEPTSYLASNGCVITADRIDVLARMVTMQTLHHALPGSCAIALAVAAAFPGTLVHRIVGSHDLLKPVRIGHTSGILAISAEASDSIGGWRITKAVMSRSARRLMAGWVYVPAKIP
ncbi:MAG: 2-methylaconitate cis-trans isomerase PrpF [Rhodocyclaceae bacterium]|nr:2-methylaconitate cis-trans isomerase PrpF [Rhodocyclaceae bacterium]